jgi:hypothetical protein
MRKSLAASFTQAAKSSLEIFDQLLERYMESGTPADQHVIVSGAHHSSWGKPYDFPQPAPDAIAHHRVSNLFRDREAHARRSVCAPVTRLQHESLGRYLGRGRRGQEIRPLPQSFHGNNTRRFGAGFTR